MIVLACPLCGIGSGTILFILMAILFFSMFAGTVLLFWGSWRDGDWNKHHARWSALKAEYPEAFARDAGQESES